MSTSVTLQVFFFGLPGFSSHHILSIQDLFAEFVYIPTWCRVEFNAVCGFCCLHLVDLNPEEK